MISRDGLRDVGLGYRSGGRRERLPPCTPLLYFETPNYPLEMLEAKASVTEGHRVVSGVSFWERNANCGLARFYFNGMKRGKECWGVTHLSIPWWSQQYNMEDQ